MTAKVYIETSIPSFYYEIRTEPDMVARKEWTRQWWNDASENYLLSCVAFSLHKSGSTTLSQYEKSCKSR